MELGPRDLISRAMMTEFEEGRGFEGPHGKYVHLDVRHLGEELIDRKLPFVRELAATSWASTSSTSRSRCARSRTT